MVVSWVRCHLLPTIRPYRGIVTTIVAHAVATGDVEAVYRSDGDRLWRALYAFTGDEDVASDAAAEAFAQALRRGSAIRDVRSWVWRSAFQIARGDLKRGSSLLRGPMPEGAFMTLTLTSSSSLRSRDLRRRECLRGTIGHRFRRTVADGGRGDAGGVDGHR